MRGKKLWAMHFGLVLALSACARLTDCSRAAVYCVALVTDTLGLHDYGITQDTWDGLTQLMEEGQVDRAEFIESVDARDYDKNISYFANLNFDVIVTSGVALHDETVRAADLYPGSAFIGMNQPDEDSRPNLINVSFAEDQMGYLAGALAAKLTQTRIVAAICEDSSLDSMWRYCEGFRAGAVATDDQTKVFIEYHDNASSEKLFRDAEWGSEHAHTLIGRGADVIFAAGGLTAQGALQAASDAGVLSIGSERDQASALGGGASGVVTSIYGRALPEVQKAIGALRAGESTALSPAEFGYVALPEPYPLQLTADLDALLGELVNIYVKTNVPSRKP